jgi:hypothetical protein
MLPIPDPCGRFGKLLSLTTAAASAANSFTGDTVVHARDNNGKAILKPIKEIRIGDEVLAWDEAALVDGQLSQAKPVKLNTAKESANTKTTRYEKVAGVVTSEVQQKLVHIKLDNGKTITATQGHPFRTEEGWRDAILLKRGGKLLLKGSSEGDGDAESARQSRTVTIEDVRVETKTIRVFNLEASNLHTFFVGEDGIVVHNGGGNNIPCGTARAAFRRAKRDANIPTSQTHNAHSNGRGDRHRNRSTDYYFDNEKTIQHHPDGHPWPSDNGSNLPHFNNHQEQRVDGGTKNHYTY